MDFSFHLATKTSSQYINVTSTWLKFLPDPKWYNFGLGCMQIKVGNRLKICCLVNQAHSQTQF